MPSMPTIRYPMPGETIDMHLYDRRTSKYTLCRDTVHTIQDGGDSLILAFMADPLRRWEFRADLDRSAHTSGVVFVTDWCTSGFRLEVLLPLDIHPAHTSPAQDTCACTCRSLLSGIDADCPYHNRRTT